jgi:hypothetical protein
VNTRTCRCGKTLDLDECRYIGPQASGEPAEWYLLFQCHYCRTTFAGDAVQDAAKCCGCGHLIVGDAEDPKVVTEHAGLYCLDCLPDSDAIKRLLHEARVQPIGVARIHQQVVSLEET